ncbi:MAG: hypothetical protein PHI32_15395 [Dysgonamonadaceae bacterium]|nr:hypothetical protein [Dysgonamonadaceae bacterium]MDD4727896.1 hypothetical protein [Dysgonamonadaceae bacterium]
MALIDKFLKKTLNDQESENPLNILVCFSKPETGKSLCKIANYFMQSKLKNEQIASLHLLEKDEYDKIDNIETFKASLYDGVMQECRKGSAMVRTFVKSSDDFVSEILSTSNELDCNLVLIGIGKTVFTPQLWGTYQKFQAYKGSSECSEAPLDTLSSKGVSSLLERNNKTTGIFIDHNLDTINDIFIPILDKSDIHIFDYIKRLAEKTSAKITIWDAIGIIESVPELKKVFSNMQRSNDERVSLWDNSKKIAYDFIKQQDLIIIGFDGWVKLISSAITWSHSLQSTLIIRKK